MEADDSLSEYPELKGYLGIYALPRNRLQLPLQSLACRVVDQWTVRQVVVADYCDIARRVLHPSCSQTDLYNFALDTAVFDHVMEAQDPV